MDMDIRQAVKEAVARVDPRADVILYGSRARGDARPDSDWDLLVITEEPVDRAREDDIRSAVYELELETSAVLTLIIHPRHEWDDRVLEAFPFSRNVVREGVLL